MNPVESSVVKIYRLISFYLLNAAITIFILAQWCKLVSGSGFFFNKYEANVSGYANSCSSDV